jgi:hypothetical protein
VTRAGRWEWAFAADAVARGDLLVLLEGGIALSRPVAVGDRFWLLPSWRSERPEAVKRTWWPELSRAHREQPADGSVPLRTLCSVVSSHPLDAAARTRIAHLHPWSTAYADRAERALLVRAHASAAASQVALEQGDDRYTELADDPPEDALLPALTDEAFALHRGRLERDLEAADAPRR